MALIYLQIQSKAWKSINNNKKKVHSGRMFMLKSIFMRKLYVLETWFALSSQGLYIYERKALKV